MAEEELRKMKWQEAELAGRKNVGKRALDPPIKSGDDDDIEMNGGEAKDGGLDARGKMAPPVGGKIEARSLGSRTKVATRYCWRPSARTTMFTEH